MELLAIIFVLWIIFGGSDTKEEDKKVEKREKVQRENSKVNERMEKDNKTPNRHRDK